MKKLLYLILPTLLLASCEKYGSNIAGTFTSQQCPMRPLDAATRDSAAKGYVVIDSSHAGNPSICEVRYVIDASWVQKYLISKKNLTIVVFYAFILLGVGLFIAGIKIGNNPSTKQKGLPIALFVAGILALAVSAAVVEWAHTKQAAIPKSTYDSLMKTDGNLKAFWDVNLYK